MSYPEVEHPEPPETPRFEHDCEECIFLGRNADQHGEFDMYYCPKNRKAGGLGSVIAREGDEDENYGSLPVYENFLWRNFNDLSRVYEAARERGLIPEHDPQRYGNQEAQFVSDDEVRGEAIFLGNHTTPDGTPVDLYFNPCTTTFGEMEFDYPDLIVRHADYDGGFASTGKETLKLELIVASPAMERNPRREHWSAYREATFAECYRRAYEAGLIANLRIPTEEDRVQIDAWYEKKYPRANRASQRSERRP